MKPEEAESNRVEFRLEAAHGGLHYVVVEANATWTEDPRWRHLASVRFPIQVTPARTH